MVRIQNLKNNHKSKNILHTLIEDREPLSWLTETFASLPMEEKNNSWRLLLLDYEEELKTLLHHSDSSIRYQSCKTLLFSESSEVRRLLWDMIHDNSQIIRSLMIKFFHSVDRQQLYNALFKRFLRDSVYSVRQEALLRIRKDFADLYSLSPENLQYEEKVHCIELLDTHSAHDHNLALRFLEDNSPGIVLAASIYLERAGTLDDMLRGGSERDLEDLERRLKILKTASEHQVCSFLNKRDNFKTHGSFFLGVEVLKSGILCKQMSWIIKTVLDMKVRTAFTKQLKNDALTCLLMREDKESHLLIKEILQLEATEEDHRVLLLENLPPAGANLFYPVLYDFIRDIRFTHFGSLVKAFRSIPLHLCLSNLYTLVRNDKAELEVRKRSLILLSHYQEFTSILYLIENLYLLSIEEMEELGKEVFRINRDQFIHAAEIVFSEHDASLHQKLMHLCSMTGIKEFIPVMLENLSDSNPQTRIRGIWSLRKLNANEYLSNIQNLLYDPDQKVRAQTAAALIDWNQQESFGEMRKILDDKNESISVQESIIGSLGLSSDKTSIFILVSLLESNPALKMKISDALLKKTSENEIEFIVELYERAIPEVKLILNDIFKIMRETAEPILMNQLRKTENQHTRKNICTVLDSTGYVESLMGELKSSFSAKRLEAAEKLSVIGTVKACRGLLLGARDINKGIRILSIKALVKIQSQTEALSLLENDPDKKVRRYAAWAKERIKAETLP